jgi:signal transduction histidine kinase
MMEKEKYTEARRLRFIETLNKISNEFISLKEENVSTGILGTLKLCCRFSGIERGYVFLLSDDKTQMELRYEWCEAGVIAHKGILESFAVSDLPDFMDSLYGNETISVHFSELSDNENDRALRTIMETLSIKSFVNIPIFVADILVGYIGFDAVVKEQTWSEESLYAFSFAGQIIGSLVVRIGIERQLKEEIKTKNKFFSILAHDLRDPFNGIIGGSKMLHEEIEKLNSPDLQELCDLIVFGAQEVQKLLEDLLTLSRTSQGTFPFEPKNYILAGIMKEVYDLFIPNLEQKKVNLDTDIPENLEVYGDKEMLKTIFRNLLSNGIKFTKEGDSIKISARDDKDSTVIIFSDTGLGMSEEKRKQLFTTGKPLTTSYGTAGESGSGMGLILTKEFIDYHNAGIEVESILGKGSSFIITLPGAPEK